MNHSGNRNGHNRAVFTLSSVMLGVSPMMVHAAERDGVVELDAVIVTAPPAAVGAEAFSVTHLESDALDTSSRLDTALSQVPGLSLFRRDSSLSANPTTQGVSLRSIAPSGAGRALVTLDGVPLNDPFGNWVIWSALPPEDIASVDVVRGAGAGPYGAGSLTGVIALTEASGRGVTAADLAAGDKGQRRVAAAGGAQVGEIGLFASGSAQRWDGFIPISSAQRGAADDALASSASNASLRATLQTSNDTAIATRVAAYNEHRDSGLVGATSSANGVLASITVAHPDTDKQLGWRLQGWFKDSNFSNSSVSVATGRVATTPSNNQYATPSQGWGGNAALRGQTTASSWSKLNATFSWELGTDVRIAKGESQEYLTYVANAFTQQRAVGGRTMVGGVYAETALRTDHWLATLGVRADEWRTTEGHLVQRSLATGAVTSEQYPDSQSGTVPSVRAGLRRDFSNVLYVRTAAYSGFRTPSLNELYRPFRVGNNITIANAALTPERLYGAEVGIGGQIVTAWSWDITLFKNELKHAITNVTIGRGPGTFTGAGFVPAGGLLIQRQNAGDIDALGAEVETRFKFNDHYALRVAASLVDATVDGGDQAAQLTGLRPAQAPHTTVTAGVVLTPLAPVQGSINYRYESSRFADDLNTIPLGSFSGVDARVEWRMTERLNLYAAVNNLTNADIVSTRTADNITSYAAPRTWIAGFRVGR